MKNRVILSMLIAIGATFALIAIPERASAISPSATTGFTYVAQGAGPPTGTPAFSNADVLPTYYDNTNDVSYVYRAGWKEIGCSSLVQTFSRDTTHANATAISNSTTETTLYSVSIPGNTLGTKRVRVIAQLALSSKASGAGTFTIRGYYGSTAATIADSVLTTSLSSRGLVVMFDLMNSSDTAHQFGWLRLEQPDATSNDGTGVRAWSALATPTIDSTTTQTLKLTGQFGTADAANVLGYNLAWVELLN